MKDNSKHINISNNVSKLIYIYFVIQEGRERAARTLGCGSEGRRLECYSRQDWKTLTVHPDYRRERFRRRKARIGHRLSHAVAQDTMGL